jgi:predicted DNA-binding transcriptional regulator YafY
LSYWKAEGLITLATLVAGRHAGVTLDEVMERFGVSKRTAQRMLRVLETLFPETDVGIDDDGRKRWRLAPSGLRDLLTLSAEEVAALDLATEKMKRSGLVVEAERLLSLRDKVMALVPRPIVARIETDLAALLEAQGLAARPGPRQRIDRKIIAAIAEAIKACRMIEVEYQSRDEPNPSLRWLAPHGLLVGLRSYLVARPDDDPAGPMRLYVIENIRSAKVGVQSFARDPTFNLQAFAQRSFGVFQNDEEFGEVVWRFLPKAAAHARGFEFHPSQQIEDQPDGSLIVRFRASGHLEMCWHLYVWGNQVEVLAPEPLCNMVHAWRRPDFPALP